MSKKIIEEINENNNEEFEDSDYDSIGLTQDKEINQRNNSDEIGISAPKLNMTLNFDNINQEFQNQKLLIKKIGDDKEDKFSSKKKYLNNLKS